MQKKASAFIIVLAALFASCYFPEVIETRIIFEADKSIWSTTEKSSSVPHWTR